eukprot:11411842-Alexandrium_andersonii.AAC.1
MTDVLDEPTSLFAVEQVNKCFAYDPFDLPEPNWGPQPDDIMSFLNESLIDPLDHLVENVSTVQNQVNLDLAYTET